MVIIVVVVIVFVFSREPQLYKRVFPTVGPLIRNAYVSAGRDKPANDLFWVYI